MGAGAGAGGNFCNTFRPRTNCGCGGTVGWLYRPADQAMMLAAKSGDIAAVETALKRGGK